MTSSPKFRLLDWLQPVVLGTAAFTVAVALALTAPTTANPPEQLGTALAVGGVVISALTLRDRMWRVLPIGLASLAGGALVLLDEQRFIQPVSLVGIGFVLVAGLISGWFLAHRDGLLAGSALAVLSVGIAGLVATYDRLLLPLALGLIGALAVATAVAGIVRAAAENELVPHLTLRRTMDLGISSMGRQTALDSAHEAVRNKVIYDGPNRNQRVFRFLTLMAFASAIASLGVIADSTAVVIGAMLVAPLLTPLMGVSLAIVAGWTKELRNASLVAGAGTAVAVAVSFAVSAVVGRGTDVELNAQIIARSSPTLLDLFIATAAGAAGAYAISRSDVSDALPGVAVAIALVPPLAVVGVAAQLGEPSEAFGALLLFATNAVAILGMGALTFFVTGTAARETGRPWRLDWWTIVLAGLSVVVLGALVANTALTGEEGERERAAARVVEDWIGTRDYEVDSVVVEDDTVGVELSGATTPGDTDDLAGFLASELDANITLELEVALTEHVTVEAD